MTRAKLLAEIERIFITKLRENTTQIRNMLREEFKVLIVKEDLKEVKNYMTELRADVKSLSKKIDTYMELTAVYIEKQKMLKKQIDEIVDYLDVNEN